jgi:hypothetical protein
MTEDGPSVPIDNFTPIDVSVTLTDMEWASVAGLLGAVIQLQSLGVEFGWKSAVQLGERIEHIEHAHKTIQQAVMDATVDDVVSHFLFQDPGK